MNRPLRFTADALDAFARRFITLGFTANTDANRVTASCTCLGSQSAAHKTDSARSKAGRMKVLSQLERCQLTLLFGKVVAINKPLVNTGRFADPALSTKQTAQRRLPSSACGSRRETSTSHLSTAIMLFAQEKVESRKPRRRQGTGIGRT